MLKRIVYERHFCIWGIEIKKQQCQKNQQITAIAKCGMAVKKRFSVRNNSQ